MSFTSLDEQIGREHYAMVAGDGQGNTPLVSHPRESSQRDNVERDIFVAERRGETKGIIQIHFWSWTLGFRYVYKQV